MAVRSPSRRGFTLIEILIVVVILGILAAIVIPQFTSATRETREAMLKDEVRYLRQQIKIFAAQHRDIAPGYPGGDVTAAADEATFVDQMTLHTNAAGGTNATATDEFKFPPYLSKMPANSLTNKSGVLVVAGAGALPDPDESQPHGWIYQPATLKLVPNAEGNDLTNVPFVNY